METLNRDDLLERFKLGDRQAFKIIYSRYWKKIYSTAFRLLQDQAQSEDLVQDLFVAVWNKRDDLDISNIEAYLVTSIRNNTIRHITAGKSKGSFYTTLDEVLSLSPSSDNSLLLTELQQKYQAYLKKMPEQRKLIFTMRFEEGLSTDTIAAKLNITRKTVQNQLLRSANDIKTMLTC